LKNYLPKKERSVSSKITFSCNHYASFYEDAPLTKTYNMTVGGESLMEVIEDFEMFLRGCGFVFDGYLDIVPNESDEQYEDHDGIEEYSTPTVPVHEWTQTLRSDNEWSFATVPVPNGASVETVNVNAASVSLQGFEEFDNVAADHSKYYFDTERNK